jgi:predicted MFS family arabinose efflux permease
MNPVPPTALRASSRALLAGNFAIGCGVMVAAGSLNDLVHALQVSVAVGGQLVSVAAVVMALGAPLMAVAIGNWDRRRLLTLALLWYAVGHAISALMPSFAALLPVRAACMLGAALFTPQAAAAINVMAPPDERGRAITFIFLGWSLASVIGMPLHSYIGEAYGWRWAFGLVALLSLIAAAWVWRAMPTGVRPPPLSMASWGQVFSSPLLMGLVAVTALSAAGQFTVFSYFAPYFKQVLALDAAGLSLAFLWFGLFGLIGTVLLSRWIDRIHPARSVTFTLGLIAVSLLAWPLAGGLGMMLVVLLPWGLGCFASNSAQQARMGVAAPAFAPALLALNTSAMYLGQAVGAAGGGAIIAATGWAGLHWSALAWVLAAIALSAWLARQVMPGALGR